MTGYKLNDIKQTAEKSKKCNSALAASRIILAILAIFTFLRFIVDWNYYLGSKLNYIILVLFALHLVFYTKGRFGSYRSIHNYCEKMSD